MNKVKIADIANIIMGQSPSSDSYNQEGKGVPFFQGKADFGRINPIIRTWCDAPIRMAEEGDILISVRAPVGDLNIADINCCIGRGLAVIRPKLNMVMTKYLYYSMKYAKPMLENQSTGSTFKAINKDVLKNLEIKLCSLAEQNECVKQMSLIESLIEGKQVQIKLYENLVKSRFIEMFGNTQNAELGSVCTMINGDRGKNYPSGKDRVASGIPFINAGHLDGRKVRFEAMDYITAGKYKQMTQGKVQRDDILYCLRGSLGKHGMVDFDEGLIASSLVIIRCDQSKILPQFVLCALESNEIKRQLEKANNGSSQPNLSAASVKKYLIPLPHIKEQEKFVNIFQQSDKSKFIFQLSLMYCTMIAKYLRRGWLTCLILAF